MDEGILALIGSLIASAIRISLPITYGALGCMLCERAGIATIGIEGMMLAGAFGAAFGSWLTGSVLFGIFFAMLCGMCIAAIHGVLTVFFRTGHIISGFGINLLANGVTVVLMEAIWGNRGKSPEVASVKNISLTPLQNIPLLGKTLSNISPFLILMLLLVLVTRLFLFNTVAGLRLRATGENPRAVDSLGVKVHRIQFLGVLAGGILASLGGAYLSIGDIGLFSRNMVAGRGYIAIAVNIFGGWAPLGIFGASMLFSLAQSIQYRMQSMNMPVQLVQILPYFLTTLALIFVRKARGPASVGISFDREEDT
jgi:simple sugar transport system permease protein